MAFYSPFLITWKKGSRTICGKFKTRLVNMFLESMCNEKRFFFVKITFRNFFSSLKSLENRNFAIKRKKKLISIKFLIYRCNLCSIPFAWSGVCIEAIIMWIIITLNRTRMHQMKKNMFLLKVAPIICLTNKNKVVNVFHFISFQFFFSFLFFGILCVFMLLLLFQFFCQLFILFAFSVFLF